MLELSTQEISDLIGALNRQRLWLQTDADGDDDVVLKQIKRLDALEDKLDRLLGH